MSSIGTPPPMKEIPVTKGCDFTFTVALTDPVTNQPVDYTGTVRMEIDLPTGETSIDATLDANTATIALPADICDSVYTTTTWRVVNSVADNLTRPLVIG